MFFQGAAEVVWKISKEKDLWLGKLKQGLQYEGCDSELKFSKNYELKDVTANRI